MIDPAPAKMRVKVPIASARSGLQMAFGIRPPGFDDPEDFSRNRTKVRVPGETPRSERLQRRALSGQPS
jgi:hypothetical protein